MRTGLWRLLVAAMALVLAFGIAACAPSDDEAPTGDDGTTSEESGETGEEAAEGGEEGAEDGDEAAEGGDEAAGGASKVPADTFVQVSIGEPESLDPAWTYETTGAALEANIYEGLVYFDRDQATEFVPALATDWEVSEDGLTYTFNIREGVTFHEGGTLEPSDIAYSLQRAMLQDRVDGPMWLFLEPILGTSSLESLVLETAAIEDEEATMDDAPDDAKIAVCELVLASVTADDEAGTVAVTVQQPTPWLLQLLAQPWGSAMDKEWMIEQGDWDGVCADDAGTATWTQWHSPEAQNSILFDAANGTGPYSLDQWKKGEEITLNANESYWRTEPIWDGGPSGPPALKRIVYQKVDEWGTRLAKLQAGEADIVAVPRANIDQVEPLVYTQYEGGDASAPSEVMSEDGTVNLFVGYPTVAMTAAMFNFAINPESQFIGSGQLGDGIPADFFSDENVRKGFQHCFDWDTFIEAALQGEGFQARGPIIRGLQGFSEDSDIYNYDLDLCEQYLAEAWDGAVAENGFNMTLAYNEGNDARKTAAEILADSLSLVNPAYQVQVQSLEWPSFLEARRNADLPISVSGWLEDYHDASNWVHPFMHSAGAYARAQSFPEEMQAEFDELIDQGLSETDEALRGEIYAQLQQLAYDNAISIFIHQATGRTYMNRDVDGYFAHDLRPGLWYYALTKGE